MSAKKMPKAPATQRFVIRNKRTKAAVRFVKQTEIATVLLLCADDEATVFDDRAAAISKAVDYQLSPREYGIATI